MPVFDPPIPESPFSQAASNTSAQSFNLGSDKDHILRCLYNYDDHGHVIHWWIYHEHDWYDVIVHYTKDNSRIIFIGEDLTMMKSAPVVANYMTLYKKNAMSEALHGEVFDDD